MNSLEIQIFSNQETCQPVSYFRYVDDTLAFTDSAQASQFLNILNSQWPSICFTMECQENFKIPFLDIELTLRENEIEFAVFRKPTFTGRVKNLNRLFPTIGT